MAKNKKITLKTYRTVLGFTTVHPIIIRRLIKEHHDELIERSLKEALLLTYANELTVPKKRKRRGNK